MKKNVCSVCNYCFNDEYFDKKEKKCILHSKKESWYSVENNSLNWNGSEKKIELFWKRIKQELESTAKAIEIGWESDSVIFYNQVIFPKFEEDTLYHDDFDNIAHSGTNFFNFMEKDGRVGTCRIFNSLEIVFKNCHFLDNVDFSRYFFSKVVKFENCIFEGNVYFSEMEFNNKFKFVNCIVKKEACFKRAKFKSLVGFEKSTFNNVNFNNTRFSSLVRFIGVTLNKSNFSFTYFYDNVLFNEMIINENIDFEKTFFEKYANFHNIKINHVIQNRETARIIKDSFEQQNNIIEANKYYALEMQKRDEEISWKDDFKDKLIFKLHEWSSEHSQNWILALFWILVISMTYSIISFCLEIERITSSFVVSSSFVSIGLLLIGTTLIIDNILESKAIKKFFLAFTFIITAIYFYVTKDLLLELPAKLINPFSLMAGNDNINGLELIAKIIIAYLIYQFIISIRQNTRRK